MDAKERESLIRLLKGRTALWMYGSGVVGDDSVQADNMTALTGFAFEEKSSGPAAAEWNVEVFPSMDPGPGPDTDLSELSPRWSPDPGRGNPVLARFPDQSVAAAAKRYKGYNSVYFGSLRCPAPVLHRIARDAGVTLLAPPGYPVVADRRFTSVTAPKTGCVGIRTLNSSRVVELDMQKGETCIIQSAP